MIVKVSESIADDINITDVVHSELRVGMSPRIGRHQHKYMTPPPQMTEGIILTPVFVMKIIDLKFLDGKFDIRMICFRRKPNCFVKPNGEYLNYNSYNNVSTFDGNNFAGPSNQQRPSINDS